MPTIPARLGQYRGRSFCTPFHLQCCSMESRVLYPRHSGRKSPPTQHCTPLYCPSRCRAVMLPTQLTNRIPQRAVPTRSLHKQRSTRRSRAEKGHLQNGPFWKLLCNRRRETVGWRPSSPVSHCKHNRSESFHWLLRFLKVCLNPLEP